MSQSTMDSRAWRFGGAMAVIVAVATALAGILYFLLPETHRLGVPGRTLLPAFAANPMPLQLEQLALAAMGLFGLGVVRPVRDTVGSTNQLLGWTSRLALIGYAVAAVGNTLTMSKLPGIASAFVAADQSGQTAIAALWRTTLDPFGLWQFGAVGLWLVIVGWVAWRRGSLPAIGAYGALAAGVASLVFPIALLFSAAATIAVLALVAGAVMAIWFAWMGWYLWRGGMTTRTG